MSDSRPLRTIAILAALTIIFAAVPSTSRGDALNQIIADWTARQKQIRRLDIIAEGTVTHAKGRHNETVQQANPEKFHGDIPAADYSYPERLRILFDADHHWARKERTDHGFSASIPGYFPREEIYFFDGERQLWFAPIETNREGRQRHRFEPELQIMGDFGVFFEGRDSAPFIALDGKVSGDVTPTRLLTPIDSSTLRVQGVAQLDGREQVVVRTAAEGGNRGAQFQVYTELWVDTARQNVVTRRMTYIGSDLSTKFDLDYGSAPEGGHWRLHGWKYQASSSGQLERWSDMKVTRYTPNPDLQIDDFRFEPTPGMVVRDEVARTSYVKGAAGQPDRSVQEIEASERESRRSWWPALALLAAAIAVVTFLYWRRKRNRLSVA